MHYLITIALLLSMKSIVAKEHNPSLYLYHSFMCFPYHQQYMLNPSSPFSKYVQYKNAFFYLSLLAMCALKMPNRNEKKGEAVWEWTLLKWVYLLYRVRWRVKVNLHSLGVCQLFVLSANTIFSMCCIRESVYHRNKSCYKFSIEKRKEVLSIWWK